MRVVRRFEGAGDEVDRLASPRLRVLDDGGADRVDDLDGEEPPRALGAG